MVESLTMPTMTAPRAASLTCWNLQVRHAKYADVRLGTNEAMLGITWKAYMENYVPHADGNCNAQAESKDTLYVR